MDHALVLGVVDRSHTRSRTAFDVIEQARSPEALVALEFGVGAGADRERTQQEVEGLPYGSHVGVGPEVPDPLALPPPHDRRTGPLLVDGHRQPRIALVILQPDVEPRLVLLDQIVLEQQGLGLGADHHPLDVVGLVDHLCCPRGQTGRVLEIGVEPLP